MKKNGFTLIELLAVIVILAIIALIATPIILGIINDAREKANERSVELYASAVKNGIAAYQLTGTSAPTSFEDLTIQYDGDVKCSVEELYEDGSFYLDGCKVNNGEKEYSYGTKKESDVVKLCTTNTTKATALVWNSMYAPELDTSYAIEEVGLLASEVGPYAQGVAYTCNFIDDSEENNMTFFVLSSTENDVTLIADSNLGDNVAWSADGNNYENESEEKQAITAKAALADRTSGWNKLTEEQKATIKLPTKEQIEESFSGEMPTWLSGNLSKYKKIYGYWTASPMTFVVNNPDGSIETYPWAFIVSYTRSVEVDSENTFVGNSNVNGIRPVITLPKSQI